MIHRTNWKLAVSAAAAAVGLMANIGTAFAEELPIQIPAPGKAVVSVRVDKADKMDRKIGTQFYLYIPPDDTEITDYPQMGDEGLSTNTFLIGAIVSGCLFLGSTGIASREEKE